VTQLRYTVGAMLSDVRRQLDEDNRAALDDELDIIPALNRALNYASDVIARKYPQALLATIDTPVAAGEDLFEIPEDAFEARLLRIEVNTGTEFIPIAEIDYRDVSYYDIANQTVAVPMYYTVIGNQFKLLPAPSGAFDLRLWYTKEPAPFVQEQGRINSVVAASNYVTVDSLGADLTSDSELLESFVNIVDGKSGKIKCTMQVQDLIIDPKKIVFKTVPTRSTVFDLPVDTSLVGLDLSPEVDDYVCLAPGSCVPFLRSPLTNFCVQYAVSELTRKFQGEVGVEAAVLDKFETQVERTWVQRPNAVRVRNRNPYARMSRLLRNF